MSSALEGLRRDFGGTIIEPGGAEYERVRHSILASGSLVVLTISAGPKPVVEAARPDLEATWRRLSPHVEGAYANFLTSATEEDVAAIYPPETYDRLGAVKRQYDPGNLFARNHNIRPRQALPHKHDGGRRIPLHHRRLHPVPATAVDSGRSAV